VQSARIPNHKSRYADGGTPLAAERPAIEEFTQASAAISNGGSRPANGTAAYASPTGSGSGSPGRVAIWLARLATATVGPDRRVRNSTVIAGSA